MTQPKHAQLDLLLSISDGLSRGLDEMLRVSPTDAMHPPSCSLAIRDAVEELKWLRAEIERQRVENERLRAALIDIARQETTGPYKWQSVVEHLCEIAREALEGEP